MRRLTGRTLTRREDLDDELDRTREDGYSIDDTESLPNLRCVAAPVFNSQQEVVCAISVSGLPNRVSTERVPVLGQLVAKTAAQLTSTLGGRPRYYARA
jgi:IclR family acetate operon transcriptional repressor